MTQTRRTFLATTGATITMLPFAAHSAGHGPDLFETPRGGTLEVHPVNHASFVMKLQGGPTIYVDPVGGADLYADLPDPDMILVTHEHGDHFDEATIRALMGPFTTIITNPGVHAKLSLGVASQVDVLANGDRFEAGFVSVDAIPAYNTTEGRLQFHPKGRDNGYVLEIEYLRIYISGDTEDIPEMRSLENIDVAFVCMNLPFTMDAQAAASAVAEFAPTYVYPYHFHGRALGTQDPSAFAEMVPDGIEVKLADWYGS